MDPVQITMLGVGVALAALVVTLNGSLRRDMDKRFDAIEKRFDDRIDGIVARLDGIVARLRLVEQGLAEVKGRRSPSWRALSWVVPRPRPEKHRPSSGGVAPAVPAPPCGSSSQAWSRARRSRAPAQLPIAAAWTNFFRPARLHAAIMKRHGCVQEFA